MIDRTTGFQFQSAASGGPIRPVESLSVDSLRPGGIKTLPPSKPKKRLCFVCHSRLIHYQPQLGKTPAAAGLLVLVLAALPCGAAT